MICKIAIKNAGMAMAAMLPSMVVAYSFQIFLMSFDVIIISSAIFYILNIFYLSYTHIGKKRVTKYAEKC
ncbi:hypothetical protein EW139_09460 [Leuconostoc kimchii]|uniref:Uncharacterized protein n=2 Tax=Leuconostoc kimchii TaxID=136609 RepID=D5T3D5_LEUKI|nr:hypothetical protein LKI_06220 [Leuconostoc kimchii IMSNU 11154]QBR48326.1 hypothetical protein EW139_09460 [Leuconostoc kimchii]